MKEQRWGEAGPVPLFLNAPAFSPSSDSLPETCLVSGDPHYYTFDKQTHHFMGNCSYTLSQLCDPQGSRLAAFNVEASNEHRWGNTHVSYVRSVDVDVLGVRITLEKGGAVKVCMAWEGSTGGGLWIGYLGTSSLPPASVLICCASTSP